ncbi:MAG TPA: MltA domain-containing protein, partial [Candidatus Limnocylindrales bacterium]|nr:MltA domain-containing protein [Candidatus Limnocylindrales bacterium]
MSLAQITCRCKFLGIGAWLLSILFLSSCAVPLTPVRPEPLAISDDLDVDSLRVAIGHSLAYLLKLPPERVVGEQPRRLTAKEIVDSLLAFEKLLDHWYCPACLGREIGARFEIAPSSADQSSEVLFTGYYQPIIEGSLVPTEEYRFPLYGKPADLATALPSVNGEMSASRTEQGVLLPYYSRREIDELGALKGRGLEIAWVKDPIEVFFLHIQGSGIIRLPDGAELNVGYAAQNGRPYRSIGRLLIDNGKIAKEEMSMQRLRGYLADNPHEQSEIFAYNESYVFFRVIPDGPIGSLEVPVTAGRSIATDGQLFPKGALALMQTEIPILDGAGQLAGWRPVTRFVLNQDTGGAIRGVQRADYYFGTGAAAGDMAGYMNRR